MGTINSTIKNHINSEFKRVLKNQNRNYLVKIIFIKNLIFKKTIDEAKLLQSLDEMYINFKKIAILYMLDADKDGKFSLNDLFAFAEFCAKITKHTNQRTFQNELQAQCTLCMWKQLSTENGKRDFIEWFGRLFLVTSKMDGKPNMLSTDVVSTIHELLEIKQTYGVTCQTLIVLMQNVGEEMGLMKLDDEELDDYVPLQVVEIFAEEFVNGVLKMMTEIGFKKEYLEE